MTLTDAEIRAMLIERKKAERRAELKAQRKMNLESFLCMAMLILGGAAWWVLLYAFA